MKTVFYGTPEVSVPFLELLAKRTRLLAAVSQPDKPAGRSLQVAPTPVSSAARRLGIRVLQPERPSLAAADLKALAPDLAVAVAYGRILKPDVLSIPRLGTLNVHFSLLPKYRGAAPVQWALAHGEKRSGVTVFWLDEGMDTGPIFVRKEQDLSEDDDAGTAMKKLAALGLAALDEAIGLIERDEILKIPQSGEPSLAPLIKREDAEVSLSLPAAQIHDRVRAFCLWPKASLALKGQRLIVLKTRLAPSSEKGRPGRVVSVAADGGILLECGLGSRLWFLSVQPEGKKPVSAVDFLNGLRLKAGDVLPISE
jgi:methionyl-tRNA formyltransferase